VGVAWLQPSAAGPTRLLVILVALGLFFQMLDVFDLFFQARGESRISALVRIASCLGGSLLKIGLILAHASLRLLAGAGLFELALAGIAWWWAGRRAGQRIASFRFDGQFLGATVRENWSLTVAALAIYVQAYADQMMIGMMIGGGELGQYSAAMRLVSVFSFIPMVVQTVAAPELARAKRDNEALYLRRLHRLYRLMFGLFLLTALPLYYLGPLVTKLLYGAAYAGAAALLPWLALRLLFVNFGVARSIFITNESLFRFALITAVAGAAANILLNLWLVRAWGARGAIASSLASFAVTTFALELFQPRARKNLRLMASAIFLPWRPFAG